MIRQCLECKKKIKVTPKMLKRGRGKFCSRSCASSYHFKGEKNPRWNGGKTTHELGYILVKAPNHPSTDRHGYVRRARLVMEKYLGRYMKPEEETHHINGIKTDDRIENLRLLPNRSKHLKLEHELGTYQEHLYKLNHTPYYD